jgi:hypothetical protein
MAVTRNAVQSREAVCTAQLGESPPQ